jgi:hypothetical protein
MKLISVPAAGRLEAQGSFSFQMKCFSRGHAYVRSVTCTINSAGYRSYDHPSKWLSVYTNQVCY